MTATLFRRFAIATLLILIATELRADVLSLITSQCQTLGATRYEILFVTSGETTATSSNIADYNNFVSAQALTGSGYLSAFVPPGTTWNAIASTTTVSASSNAPAPAGIPVFDTLGDLLSTNLYNSSGTIQINPEATQSGGTLQNATWTGTLPDGGLSLSDALGTDTPIEGFDFNQAQWIDAGPTPMNSSLASTYAISSPINVVPEPATLALSGSALLGLGLVYLQRRRAKASGPPTTSGHT